MNENDLINYFGQFFNSGIFADVFFAFCGISFTTKATDVPEGTFTSKPTKTEP